MLPLGLVVDADSSLDYKLRSSRVLVRNISGVLMILASFYYSGVTSLDCGAEEAMDLMRRLFDLAGSPSLLILFKEEKNNRPANELGQILSPEFFTVSFAGSFTADRKTCLCQG